MPIPVTVHVTRTDTPVDPKGGRLTSHDLAKELLFFISPDLAAYVNDQRYIEVMRVLDLRLQDPALEAPWRAQHQAALDACREATLDALADIG